jgi:hypothetical protein
VTEHAELATLKQKARRLAIAVADHQDWCSRGLNDGLHYLGLAEYTQEYPRAEATPFTGTATITLLNAEPGTTVEVRSTDWDVRFEGVEASYPKVRLTAQGVEANYPKACLTAQAGEDDTGTVTVSLRVEVLNTRHRRTATSWVKGALGVVGSSAYQVSVVWDSVVWEGTDPDTPGAYDDEDLDEVLNNF